MAGHRDPGDVRNDKWAIWPSLKHAVAQESYRYQFGG